MRLTGGGKGRDFGHLHVIGDLMHRIDVHLYLRYVEGGKYVYRDWNLRFCLCLDHHLSQAPTANMEHNAGGPSI
jgi:hypothetical protein